MVPDIADAQDRKYIKTKTISNPIFLIATDFPE